MVNFYYIHKCFEIIRTSLIGKLFNTLYFSFEKVIIAICHNYYSTVRLQCLTYYC